MLLLILVDQSASRRRSARELGSARCLVRGAAGMHAVDGGESTGGGRAWRALLCLVIAHIHTRAAGSGNARIPRIAQASTHPWREPGTCKRRGRLYNFELDLSRA